MYNRSDMEQVLAASPQPDVKELLHGLQLTIEFEAQLTKRYEKLVNKHILHGYRISLRNNVN